jgi:rare lipoprotein A
MRVLMDFLHNILHNVLHSALHNALSTALVTTSGRRSTLLSLMVAGAMIFSSWIFSSCASSVRFTSAGGADYRMIASRPAHSTDKASSAATLPRSSSKVGTNKTSSTAQTQPITTGAKRLEESSLEPTDIVFFGGASYYGDEFNGRRTANGEVYDHTDFSAAHRTLPFGTILKVKNLANDKTVIVRVNDRGPFKPDRVVDLSKAAAEELGYIRDGVATVEVVVMR